MPGTESAKLLFQPFFDELMAKNKSLIREFWDFLKVRKVWWLTPIIVMLLLVTILIVFSQTTTLSPFIYALF
jgi:cell division protein FtsL